MCCPRGPKRLWATEISWDSSPPDPQGVPIAEHARWLEQALYVLWSQGVDTRPLAADRRRAAESELCRDLSGRPLLPERQREAGRAGVSVSRSSPIVSIAATCRPGAAPPGRRARDRGPPRRRWEVVRKVHVRTHQVFVATLALRGRAILRARVGAQISLTWTQGS